MKHYCVLSWLVIFIGANCGPCYGISRLKKLSIEQKRSPKTHHHIPRCSVNFSHELFSLMMGLGAMIGFLSFAYVVDVVVMGIQDRFSDPRCSQCLAHL